MYYDAGIYDSSGPGTTMSVAAAKNALYLTQGDPDPIIGFTCDSGSSSCSDTASGQVLFIRQSKTPLPYPNWPNYTGCTWLRGDINPGW
jgi:hypothetical protein